MEQIEMRVDAGGVQLDGGIVIPGAPRGVALLLHGIPSTNPPEPGDTGYPGLAETFAGRGWAAAWVDMRGARSSGGHFSIAGWVDDAFAALEKARRMLPEPPPQTVVVGSSAGGAVATELVRRGAPVDALVLLAAPAVWVSFAADPYEALRRITEEAGMPVAPVVIEDPVEWAAEFEAVTAEVAAAEVSVPLLVMHGTADDVVPPSHASRIADAAPDATLRMLEGAGHQLRREPEAIRATLDWLDEVLR